MATYFDLLKSPEWQKKRLSILDRDEFTCQNCGNKDIELQIHHLKYGKKPWLVDDPFLKTLCKECHIKVTKINNSIKNSLADFQIYSSIEEYELLSELIELILIDYSDDRALRGLINYVNVLPNG